MKPSSFAVAGLLLLASATCFSQQDVLTQASGLELQGHFKEAAATLDSALAGKTLAPAQRKQLEFELDRLERIKRDFPFTKDGLLAALKKSVKDLTPGEFDKWVSEGRFDSREIDGSCYFMTSSVRNLFFRYPELAARQVPPKDTTKLQKARLESCRAIKQAAAAERKPYVLPKRFHATMTVTAKANAVAPGETVRAWLPLPRQYPYQTDFELASATPTPRQLAGKDSPIRSAYTEQLALKDKATEFKIQFDYTTFGVKFDVKPEAVQPCEADPPDTKQFTREGPHVVFTPELRALSAQIVGNETNPCLKAKKCFDWIAEHIRYSFAIEYSTIRNISDYCRSKGYGDCGQEAMLFISLCRLNGVPARWQSGWNTFPGDEDIHDWCEIYLAPYGWMPVDPYMGIFAMQYAPALAPAERREIRDFFFGGLDQYRMAANGDHSQTLTPPKQSMRSDDVDFQRGELEADNHNLYFDRYNYEFNLKEIKLPHGKID
ncbi:MAG TPA: transglutaminase-like domain-containing protein [Candidatus Binatia bacterium]|jgi:transglutaminase-like putative cysteine protease|nr:transglutaminase-like domain-containing protein [Candidatus Binatia bacterium]